MLPGPEPGLACERAVREPRPLVQPGLRCTPVILMPPVRHELLQVIAWDPIRPAGARQFIRPPHMVEPFTQIIWMSDF